MKKILILAANPRQDLKLDREIRDLQGVIERSRDRDKFEVVSGLAVRVGDLQDLLLRYQPQIVHFCGHGSGEQGLVFEDEQGGERRVRTDALSGLFRLFERDVECVLLNACYSEEQANAIVEHINYAIGMNQEIRDDAAIAFSKGFYRALGYDRSIEEAFDFGCNAIQLEISGSSKVRSAVSEAQRKLEVIDAVKNTSIPEHLKPILKIKPSLTTTPHPKLSPETRTTIQLEIDKSLEEEDSKVKQYREQVKEYLSDRKLEDFEKVLLDVLRDELGLSPEKANQILEEELAPIRQAKQAYKTRLNALIKHYPFNDAIKSELKKFQAQRNLTDEEVDEISRPILEQAEIAHQEKLRQQAQQADENKRNRYEQEFIRAINAGYPIEDSVRNGLRSFQQSLGLSDEDIGRIEQPIIAPKQAEYQQKLAEAQRQREQEEEKAKERSRQQEVLERLQREYAERKREQEEATKREQQRQLELERQRNRKSTIPALQRIPHRFEVATIKVSRNLLERIFSSKIVIDRQPKQDWQYVETLAPNLTLELIKIPAGEFIMGAPKEEAESYDDERPQHRVKVPEFYLGKYPITQAQWRFGASLPQIDRQLDPDPSYFKGDNLPVERVSWLDAIEFCARLSRHTKREYRLPSEAEWEYACRAGTTTPFHFGETISSEVANYRAQDWEIRGTTYPGKYGDGKLGEFRGKTTPVGSFKVANNYGLFDMHGNVWEWCQDHWHRSYQGAPSDGKPWVDAKSSETAPRVLRGGSWYNAPRVCRSAVRSNFIADIRDNIIGFRVVMPARTL